MSEIWVIARSRKYAENENNRKKHKINCLYAIIDIYTALRHLFYDRGRNPYGAKSAKPFGFKDIWWIAIGEGRIIESACSCRLGKA